MQIIKGVKIIALVSVFAIQCLHAQTPTYMFDEKSGQEIMLGICEDSFLKKGVFGESYSQEYPNYLPNTDTISKLKSILNATKKHYEIVVILGTWCGDSKEQVPRFMKVMDLTDNPYLSIRSYICVDRTKTAPNTPMEEYKIEKVPTFIIYYEGVEVGRIIETPLKTLETDLLQIIQKQ